MLIDETGRLAAVGTPGTVPVPPGAELIDLAGAALLPGLVNTHTHLELGGFPESAASQDFDRWILGIRRLKLERRPEEYLAAARAGVRECWALGVTTVADTGDSGATLMALAELGGGGIVYQEVFGPDPGQLGESFEGLTRRVAQLRPAASARVRLGVSPHAPYTVSGPLFARVAAWAREAGLPLAVHVAESAAETAFVTGDTGPFAMAWRARGIPPLDDPRQQPGGSGARPRSPVAWLDTLGVLGPDTLCIHAVQLDQLDIALLAERGAAVAHCPVSNAAHRHGVAPLSELLRKGVVVGIGTDSAASVGTLDLFREARKAAEQGGLAPEAALELATRGGARALRLEREIGTLDPGKWGDVVAVRTPEAADPTALARAVLAARPGDVLLTVLGGRLVHRAPPA